MNTKRILLFSAILMIAIASLSMISASNDSDTIVMGKIIDSTFEASNFVEQSLPTAPGSTPSVSDNMVKFDFTINAEIDISNMSDADKKALNEAINSENSSLVINMTDDLGSISFEKYSTIDSAYIEDNSLFIQDNSTMTLSYFSDDSIKITAIGLNDNGKHFVTD